MIVGELGSEDDDVRDEDICSLDQKFLIQWVGWAFARDWGVVGRVVSDSAKAVISNGMGGTGIGTGWIFIPREAWGLYLTAIYSFFLRQQTKGFILFDSRPSGTRGCAICVLYPVRAGEKPKFAVSCGSTADVFALVRWRNHSESSWPQQGPSPSKHNAFLDALLPRKVATASSDNLSWDPESLP